MTWLAAAMLASPAIVLSGCAGATAPREYRKPRSHITGRGGGRGGRD